MQVPIIGIYMKDSWQGENVSKWAKLSANINRNTGFWDFTFSPKIISIDEQELFELLNSLLGMSQEERENTMSLKKIKN